MSNNIFLRSNNRFNVLDDDSPNSFKEIRIDTNRGFGWNKDLKKHSQQTNSSEIYRLGIGKENELFPDLTNTSKIMNTTNKKHIANFKDILVNVVEDISVVNGSKQISPGLVQITKINGVITYNFGILAQYTTKYQEDDSCNYNMNKAISDMNNNRKKYENEYDSINGENAFFERFTMKPIYGSSYDSDEDEVSTDENDNDDDYDYDEV